MIFGKTRDETHKRYSPKHIIKRYMKRHVMTILASAAATIAMAQGGPVSGGSLAQEDSLMNVARGYADMGNFSEAINVYSKIPTERARVERAAAFLEMGNVVRALSEAKAMGKEKDFSLKDDALLIEARCRERQGFIPAARRMYRRLARHNHAEGMYYFASHLHTIGHQTQAAELCQRAIRADRQLTPAHKLMSEIELARGHRYQSLLPLYRYMLSASDEGRKEAAQRLLRLWRRGGLGIDLFGKRMTEDKYSEEMEPQIDAIIAAIPASGDDHAAMIAAIAERTDSLLSKMRDTGEDNLDFWQVEYADFLIEIHARGYVRPMVYFLFEPLYKTEVLTWLSENAGDFEEFMEWMGGRL